MGVSETQTAIADELERLRDAKSSEYRERAAELDRVASELASRARRVRAVARVVADHGLVVARREDAQRRAEAVDLAMGGCRPVWRIPPTNVPEETRRLLVVHEVRDGLIYVGRAGTSAGFTAYRIRGGASDLWTAPGGGTLHVEDTLAAWRAWCEQRRAERRKGEG